MILVLVGGLILLYAFYDPSAVSFFPRCPFYVLTGWYCPGCGSQRALHSLLHGKIGQAVNFNLMLVLYLPLITVHFLIGAFNSVARKKTGEIKLVNNVAFIFATLFLFIAFWILRNTETSIGNYLAP